MSVNSDNVKITGNVDLDNEEDLSFSTGIVSNLISNGRTTSIVKGDRNRAEAEDNSKAWAAPDGDGTGSNATVYFNPDYKGLTIPNVDGTAGRPNFIGLGHELVHANDIVSGTGAPTGYDATVPVILREGGKAINVRVQNFPQNEISTYSAENRIRSQYKIPGRAQPTVRGLAPASVYEKGGYYVPKRNRGN